VHPYVLAALQKTHVTVIAFSKAAIFQVRQKRKNNPHDVNSEFEKVFDRSR
jgi:hypothetical protein